jgi:hypothetical protein
MNTDYRPWLGEALEVKDRWHEVVLDHLDDDASQQGVTLKESILLP